MTSFRNRDNWFKYTVLISKNKEYSYAASTTFDHPDFSWKEFAHEFIPLLRNSLRATQNEVPTLLAEAVYCLKELRET